MIQSLNNSYSALRAINTGMNVSSNNVANVDTNEFKNTQTIMNEGDKTGVVVSLSKDATEGALKQVNNELLQTSNTDIAKEMTNYIQYQNNYSANIKSIQTTDDMLGMTIDMKA